MTHDAFPSLGFGRPIAAVGLMSGTSLDGIDVALIGTDGETVSSFGPVATIRYEKGMREAIRAVLGEVGGPEKIAVVERALTRVHATAVRRWAMEAKLDLASAAVVGFPGQTIVHRPDARYTRQIGDGPLLAADLSLPVVFDFRTADVKAGGQGAPLVPVFHRALAHGLEKPLAILNLGGVGNVTWIGEPLIEGADAPMLAFDTGPGNALIDDWIHARTGHTADWNGALANAGRVNYPILDRWMEHPWFSAPPPKSLDRDTFASVMADLQTLSTEDGAATLVAFTSAAVAKAATWLPEAPKRWLVAGGGRLNPAIMSDLAMALGVSVEPVEAVGWNGDALEAQAFAFLAVRVLRGLPLTFPTTTGCPQPLKGGQVALPPAQGETSAA